MMIWITSALYLIVPKHLNIQVLLWSKPVDLSNIFWPICWKVNNHKTRNIQISQRCDFQWYCRDVNLLFNAVFAKLWWWSTRNNYVDPLNNKYFKTWLSFKEHSCSMKSCLMKTNMILKHKTPKSMLCSLVVCTCRVDINSCLISAVIICDSTIRKLP